MNNSNQHQHTPGPWDLPNAAARHGSVLVSARRGDSWDGMIATCDAGDYARSAAEGLANARLIAAAPDLLASLSELTEVLPGLISQLPYGAPMSLSEMHDRALAAIAKAQGRAS